MKLGINVNKLSNQRFSKYIFRPNMLKLNIHEAFSPQARYPRCGQLEQGAVDVAPLTRSPAISSAPLRKVSTN